MAIIFFDSQHKGILNILRHHSIICQNYICCFSKSLRSSLRKFTLCSKELHAVHELFAEKSCQRSNCINFSCEIASCLITFGNDINNIADLTIGSLGFDSLRNKSKSHFDVGFMKSEILSGDFSIISPFFVIFNLSKSLHSII